MAYRVNSSRSNDIWREEMHLVTGRPRPSTCRTSAVTRVFIPIVKHERVLYVRTSIPADLDQYPHHTSPPHTHPSDPLETAPRNPVLRSKVVVGSSDEPPPIISCLPRVHPAGHMHQSVYHAPLRRWLGRSGSTRRRPSWSITRQPQPDKQRRNIRRESRDHTILM